MRGCVFGGESGIARNSSCANFSGLCPRAAHVLKQSPGLFQSEPGDVLSDSRRARRGFCEMSRKAQNPRQAWTACLVLQRSGSLAKPRPFGFEPKRVLCPLNPLHVLPAHAAWCWRSNHPVLYSNAHDANPTGQAHLLLLVLAANLRARGNFKSIIRP